ncbi:DNA binding [Ascochyta rabiei]|uniref:DNA binding n=1 Tax=Didymella rabiei TaxID=5454 RepID=A0A162ZS78_DIDRA|nr:DNA binding [Ascochyta rabiei]
MMSSFSSTVNGPRDLPTRTCDNDRSSDGLPRSLPPRLNIFNNIRATQDTPRGRIELFYGASSPFSVLPHLDAHVPMQGSPVVYLDTVAEEIQNGNRSIRSYNYQNIVFDHLPSPDTHLDGLGSTSYASAKIALRNFLVTACPRLPFLDPGILCANFESMYSRNTGVTLFAAEKALVITALGLGALPLIELSYRQLFIEQARAEAVTMLYDINMKTVQVTLMMALFEFQAGSPNICYLHLGSAIRKAFAAGVHRTDTHEAKQTMWALYCNESMVSFTLGKQPGLAEKHITLPRADDASHSAHLVRLCTIVRSAYRIYHLDDTVVADLTAARSVHQQLCDFSALIKKNTRLEIVYYVTKLLLFRPFLLLCLELKRRGVNDVLRERNGGVEMVELHEAAEHSMQAARDIVDFCDSLFSLDIGIEGLYNHAFYLESACFVLGLAAVYNAAHGPSDYLEKVQTGLRLLRRLGSREPVRSTSAAVEQMINRIYALPERSGPLVRETISGDQLPTATANPSHDADQSANSIAALSTTHPEQEVFAPVGWNDDILLDDLWSMMDWNVGFPSMDLTSTPGL